MRIHEILQKYLKKKKRRVRGYSLRILAQEMSLSPSFVSRMLNGQRPITSENVIEFGKSLEIEAEVLATLLKSPGLGVKKEPSAEKLNSEIEKWALADVNHNRILRHWYYLAILEITTLQNFDGSLEMIAERLDLSLTVVEVAVRELLSLELLEEKDGLLVKTNIKLRWSTNKSLAETRAYHHQMMTKAQGEMQKFSSAEDFAKRLIFGITVTASSKKIEDAKKKLNECLYQIANELIEDVGDEVYQLSSQFFPLTHFKK